jgi:methylenetetrahydrofolate dehydrogenase (NADP+)/methenyltetrahydrofolate cyclohydrolase
MTKIIDGKAVAAGIRNEIKKEAAHLKKRKGIVPGLAFLTVGEDPASHTYVRMKNRACADLGFRSWQYSYPEHATTAEVLERIEELNGSDDVHGILVQLPLPMGLDTYKILLSVKPEKDVDGFHPVNLGKALLGMVDLVPCTPMGIIELLLRSGESWDGKNVVIVGRSNTVGKPLAALLMQHGARANATVTVCHTGTADLRAHTRHADIVVAAVGRPRFLKADMIREGAVVVDVGINRVEDALAARGYRIVGDVDFDAVARKAAAITPVPGGVGPMTITMLLSNTLKAATKRAEGR